ncbi:MAG: MFS transporter, partial [Rhizorhabdus sp.]
MASFGENAARPDDSRSPIAAFALPRQAMIALSCFTATLASSLIYDALPPIMSDLARHFGGGRQGAFLAQLAGTLPLFGVMIGGLMSGPLIERYGLRLALLGAMALFGLAGSAGAVLDSATPFLTARLVMGVAAGLMTTACTTLVAIFFRGGRRARMNGFIISMGSIGGIVFVLIAGWTAIWWWRAPFLLHGAVVLVFLLPVLLAGAIP